MSTLKDTRSKILTAITSTDSQSPFVSPAQLTDALLVLLSELTDMLNLRTCKEWMTKEELKRRFSLSDYRSKLIITEHHVPTRFTKTGKKLYSYKEFEKAYRQAII